MEWFESFWQVYNNLILTIGVNALLALSIWLTLSCGLLAMATPRTVRTVSPGVAIRFLRTQA